MFSQGKGQRLAVVGDYQLDNDLISIDSEDYVKCEETFFGQSVSGGLNGVCIQGLPGTGKTIYANKLIYKYYLRNHQDFSCFIVYLNCDSVVQFGSSIKRLHDYVKRTPAPATANSDTLIDLLKEVTNDRNYQKFLFFLEDIRIVDAWKVVKWLGGEMFENRKQCHVICTTREVEQSSCTLTKLEMQGFTMADVKKLFYNLNGDMADVDLQKLSESVSGHPMALVCAKEACRFRDMPAGEWVDSYIQELKEFELSVPAGSSDRKGIPAITSSINSLCDSNDVYRQLLRVVCFFNEKTIPVRLLHASLEAVNVKGPREVLNVRKKVREFIGALSERFFGKYFANTGHLTIHSLVKEIVMKDICSKPNELQSLQLHGKPDSMQYCGLACLALNRIMDRDGRFGNSTEDRFLLFPHASSVLDSLNSLRVREKCSLTQQISYIDLMAGMAYCHLSAGSSVEGKKFICEAVNYACMLFVKRSFDELTANMQECHMPVEEYVPQLAAQLAEISLKLYNGCKEKNKDEEFKKHVSEVQLYKKLSERDMEFMDISKRDTQLMDHLQPEILGILRENKKALSEEQMLQVYLPETLANLFYLRARLYTFHTDERGNQEFLNGCYNSAMIARKIYELTEQENGIELLNTVLVTRDCELNYRLKSENFNSDVRYLQETLDDFKRLEKGTGNRYFDMGLYRGGGVVEKDTTHVIRCLEWQMLAISYMHKLEPSERRFQEGEKLFERSMEISKKASNRSKAFSHQKHAEFLRTCKKINEAIAQLVTALYYLSKEFKDFKEIREGHFKRLCVEIQKYLVERERLEARNQAINLTEAEKNYIISVIRECQRDNPTRKYADTLHRLL